MRLHIDSLLSCALQKSLTLLAILAADLIVDSALHLLHLRIHVCLRASQTPDGLAMWRLLRLLGPALALQFVAIFSSTVQMPEISRITIKHLVVRVDRINRFLCCPHNISTNVSPADLIRRARIEKPRAIIVNIEQLAALSFAKDRFPVLLLNGRILLLEVILVMGVRHQGLLLQDLRVLRRDGIYMLAH